MQYEDTVDEISVRKGQRYLTVVVDHDTGRLVWAHPAATSKTVEKFLDLLGKDRCEQIQFVSCDGRLDHRPGLASAARTPSICPDPYRAPRGATGSFGVRDPTAGLSRQPGEAEGSLTPELRGRAASSPDNDATRGDYRIARARQARRTVCDESEPVIEPPQAKPPAQTRRIRAGQAVRGNPEEWRGTRLSSDG